MLYVGTGYSIQSSKLPETTYVSIDDCTVATWPQRQHCATLPTLRVAHITSMPQIPTSASALPGLLIKTEHVMDATLVLCSACPAIHAHFTTVKRLARARHVLDTNVLRSGSAAVYRK